MSDLHRGAPGAGPAGAHRDTARAPPLGERRALSAPYDSLSFPLVTRARRELLVTLAAQPVFELARSAPVGRRVRRAIRHTGGEAALIGGGRKTLDPIDLKRLDLQTLSHGLDLLRPADADTGVLPAFWRTVTASAGRFALLCEEMAGPRPPGTLLIEILGGLEQAPLDEVEEALALFETSTLGVILHLAPDPSAVARLEGLRPQCLALDFAGVAHESAREWEPAARLIASARRVCDQVLLINLRPDRGLAAQAAGATHAVFAGLDPITV